MSQRWLSPFPGPCWAYAQPCTSCKLLDIQEYVGAFQGSLWLANPPGFSFKFLARLLFAPSEITALSCGDVANRCYCFSKALGVGLFFPQLSWALSQINSQPLSENWVSPRSCKFGQNMNCTLGMVLLMDLQKWSHLSTAWNTASFCYTTKLGKEGRWMWPQVKMSQTPTSSQGSVVFSWTYSFQVILWLWSTARFLEWLIFTVLPMFSLF